MKISLGSPESQLASRPFAGEKRIIKRRISDMVYIVAQRFVADSQDYFEQLRLGIARSKVIVTTGEPFDMKQAFKPAT